MDLITTLHETVLYLQTGLWIPLFSICKQVYEPFNGFNRLNNRIKSQQRCIQNLICRLQPVQLQALRDASNGQLPVGLLFLIRNF